MAQPPFFAAFDGVGKGLGSAVDGMAKPGQVFEAHFPFLSFMMHDTPFPLDICGAELLRTLPIALEATGEDSLGHDQSHLEEFPLDICGALLPRMLPIALLVAIQDSLGHHICSGDQSMDSLLLTENRQLLWLA
jgi:hypothetical protein